MSNRPYQTECLDAIRLNAIQGCNRQLVVLPTASGKTVVFSQLPTALRMRRPDKMLVLVQADELAFQAVDKLQRANPTLKVGMEKASYKASWSDDIIVGSVQTLGGTKAIEGQPGQWDWSKRLRNLNPDEITKVVIDEVHHCTAKNYHGVMRYFGVMKSDPAYNNPDKFLLGVTATPNRSDNKGLEGFFEKIVYSRDIRTMIREGWLAEPIGHRVDTMVSLDGVRVTTGINGKDYAEGELSKTVNTPERNSLIVDKYLELGEGAPFIGLTVDIQHTIDLTEMFRSRGVTCYGIASKSERQCEWLITDTSERRDIIQRYNNGEFKGLISCQALLEGFDAPRATVCLWARPTKSGLLYTQGTGRVLRPFPAPEAAATWTGWRKQHAIVIDFVDNCSTVGAALMTIPTLFGLRPDFNMQGKSAMKVLDEVERIKASKPAVNAELYTNLDALRAVSERIDLFAVPTTPPEIQTASKFTWTTGLSDGTYQLQLPDKGLLSIKINALGEFEVSKHVTGVKTPLGIGRTLAEALRMADATVPAEAMILLKNDASWRKTPPSDPQISALKRAYPELRRPFASDEEFVAMVRHSYNKGQVSQLLAARPNPYAGRGR